MLERLELKADDDTHRNFWKGENFKLLKKAIIALSGHLKDTKLSKSELFRRVSANAVGTIEGSADSFRKHFSEKKPGAKTPLPEAPRKYRSTSIACGIVAIHLGKSGYDETLEPSAEIVRKFYDKLQSENILHDPAKLAKSHTGDSIEINPNLMRISHLERFVRIIPGKSHPDPDNPEFPLNAPRSPATPAIHLEEKIGKSSDQKFTLIIKDESLNPSGNHKDRWALEMLFEYRERIKERLVEHKATDRGSKFIEIPSLSIISSGGAAFALQSLLSLYNLPPLRVVMHNSPRMRRAAEKLKLIGAIVEHVALFGKGKREKYHKSEGDVLSITRNINGWDITTRGESEPYEKAFYDWLICEILNERPDFIFVPFGTGDLYGSILWVLNDAISDDTGIDDRLQGIETEELKGINVLGATTENPNSSMDKLYSAFQPSKPALRKLTEKMKKTGFLGKHSGVYVLSEPRASEARKWFEDHEELIGRAEPSGTAGLGLFREMQKSLDLTPTIVTASNGKGEKVIQKRVLIVNTGLYYVPRGS